MNKYVKLKATGCNVSLKVVLGHFATNHSHINYYIDTTTLKARQSEAREVAKALAPKYLYDTIVDTIICLEGMEVVGAYLAEELSRGGVMSMNTHNAIYVIKPEFNSNSQMIFRDNFIPMIKGKNVILLMSSISTGKTINKGMECVMYYGGTLRGIAAIFSALEEENGVPINTVFSTEDVPGYQTYDYRDCPFCKKGEKLDALVNCYGYSLI